MNIQTLSVYQRGTFNLEWNIWDGMNLFKEYIVFCQRRRSYKRKLRKGLTRSVIGLDKRLGKARAYTVKIARRAIEPERQFLKEVIADVATEVAHEAKKHGKLYSFFARIFARIFG